MFLCVFERERWREREYRFGLVKSWKELGKEKQQDQNTLYKIFKEKRRVTKPPKKKTVWREEREWINYIIILQYQKNKEIFLKGEENVMPKYSNST